jgi:hypothetical protein
MTSLLQTYWRRERVVAAFGSFFWLLSLILMPASVALGLAWSRVGARGYFQKPNWFLYPVFLPLMLWLVYVTWFEYVKGWKAIRKEGVLRTNEYRRVSREQFVVLLQFMRRYRPILFAAACVIGITLTTIDSNSAFSLFSKSSAELADKCLDRDFFIAAVLTDYFPRASWIGSIWFATWCYLMQGALIALSFMCLLQILFHGLLFTFFESTSFARKNGLSISLRADDPAKEFGLGQWNYAINRGYIFVAAGMAIPLVSHWSQIGGPCPKSTGQRLFTFFLWAILAAPTLLPLLARFSRKREVAAMVIKADDKDFSKDVEEQRLWPFDKDNIGKISLAISFVEYLLISDLMHTDKVVEWILKSLGA